MGENVAQQQNYLLRLQLVRATYWFTKHWLFIFALVFGLYNLLPFAAPVLMKAGWSSWGNLIYDLYSTQCHQMAQRSFFLFGERPMYGLGELHLNLTGSALGDTLSLRSFRGNDILGWKVAWSDRMVYMYGGIWLISIVYALALRHRFKKPFSIWLFIVFLIPLGLDGLTHLLSDLSGLTAGFRYDNAWLARLTDYQFAPDFYEGDAFGSFNSIARFVTGILFAIGVSGLLLPMLHHEMKRWEYALALKLLRHQSRVGSTAVAGL